MIFMKSNPGFSNFRYNMNFKLILLALNYCSIFSLSSAHTTSKMSTVGNIFKYFAYGSNLLEERLHFQVKSARRVTTGQLKNFRLDFHHWSHRWQGNSATIVPDEGKSVWGAIWDVDLKDLGELERQEGVPERIYEPSEVEVEGVNGEKIKCRTYILVNLPRFSSPLPRDRYPSKTYLDTIIRGATESQLPQEYIASLKQIPHNEYNGPALLHI